MSDLLQRGIAALKAGDKVQARRLLGRAIQTDPQDEQAWLWLSGAVESDQERLRCLNKALEINPASEAAKRGLAALQEKQASKPAKAAKPFPWVAEVPLAQPQPPQPVPATLDHSRTLDQLPPEQRKALEGFSALIAQELASGRSRKEIVKRLVKRGFPRKAVKQLVDEVARMAKRTRRTQFKDIRQGWWTVRKVARLIIAPITILAMLGASLIFFKGDRAATLLSLPVGLVIGIVLVWLLGRAWD
ncbi:MAG: hypothetical protein ACE5OS_01975 [Anaerolineae bacterium]